MQDQTPVTIVKFDILDYEKEIIGVVVKLDQQLQRLKIENEVGAEWVPFYDVLSVRQE
jgi:hypothetical protein